MAISVAPLTTVVMNSVEQERAGTASGIDNAVARVAGVLAVAVLGAVMAAAFAHSLRHSLDAKLMSCHCKPKHSDIRRPVPAAKSATCGRGFHPYNRPVECGQGSALLCPSANERPKPGERISCEHW
jgi:hypothetical protein